MPVSPTTFLVMFAVCALTVELAYLLKMKASDGRIVWWDSLRWVVGRNRDAPKLVKSRAIYLALVPAILIWFVNATTYHTFGDAIVNNYFFSGGCYGAGNEYFVWVSQVPPYWHELGLYSSYPCIIF